MLTPLQGTALQGAPETHRTVTRVMPVPDALVKATWLKSSTLRAIDVMLWAILAERCIESSWCHPRRETISADLGGTHPNTITKAGARLRAADWLHTKVVFDPGYKKSRSEYQPQHVPARGGQHWVDAFPVIEPLRASAISAADALTYLSLMVLRPFERALPTAQIAALIGVSDDTLRRHRAVLIKAGLLPAVDNRKTACSGPAERRDRVPQNGVPRKTPTTGTPPERENPQSIAARAALNSHQRLPAAARAETTKILSALPSPYAQAPGWAKTRMLTLIWAAMTEGASPRAIAYAVPDLHDPDLAAAHRQIPALGAALNRLRTDLKVGTRCADCGQIGGGSQTCDTCHPDRPWSPADQAAIDAMAAM